MTPTDEELGAYVDGELDPTARVRLADAIARDPGLAARVAKLDVLNRQLRGAFKRALTEPVPDRLMAAVRAPTSASVVQLDLARAAKAPSRVARRPAFEWGAIAASVIVGVVVGRVGFGPGSSEVLAIGADGVTAGPALAAALSTQLASDPRSTAGVAIGLSFREKGGAYCRTFTVSDRTALAGVACRDGDRWRIGALSEAPATSEASGSYRLAASPLDPAIRETVGARIDGEPFDAAAEERARARGWR